MDAQSGLVHHMAGTAANVSDVSQTRALLHGAEKSVHADAGYQGADKRPEMDLPDIHWQIAAKRGKIKAMAEGVQKELLKQCERAKAQVRSLVEHPFHIIKNLFKHRKVRYRGLAKNTAQLQVLFALANLVIASRRLNATAAA